VVEILDDDVRNLENILLNILALIIYFSPKNTRNDIPSLVQGFCCISVSPHEGISAGSS